MWFSFQYFWCKIIWCTQNSALFLLSWWRSSSAAFWCPQWCLVRCAEGSLVDRSFHWMAGCLQNNNINIAMNFKLVNVECTLTALPILKSFITYQCLFSNISTIMIRSCTIHPLPLLYMQRYSRAPSQRSDLLLCAQWKTGHICKCPSVQLALLISPSENVLPWPLKNTAVPSNASYYIQLVQLSWLSQPSINFGWQAIKKPLRLVKAYSPSELHFYDIKSLFLFEDLNPYVLVKFSI